jgi:hypothetical protein
VLRLIRSYFVLGDGRFKFLLPGFRAPASCVLPANHLATFKAFAVDYIPGFPEALLETVDRYSAQGGYNKTISIIQSSGTGKSRGVAEAARIRFSFLFNLRRNVEHYSTLPRFLLGTG